MIVSTKKMSSSSSSSTSQIVSIEQQAPTINNNNNTTTSKNNGMHDEHAVAATNDDDDDDVDENTTKIQNINISNKDDVEAAISNSNQKLLIDNSHQLYLPSQQQQQQDQPLLQQQQRITNACENANLSEKFTETNSDKLTEKNQLFSYKKCLSSVKNSNKNNQKCELTCCKKLINLRRKSKSDPTLNEKSYGQQLIASHDCWKNFTSNSGKSFFSVVNKYLYVQYLFK